jgi:hypothetical protein
MGKDNHRGPDFLVPIPYIPEEEKEADPSDGGSPSIKLLLDSDGKKIDNPTVQVQPIFYGGTTEQFLKWFQSLSSLFYGQTLGEHYRLALQSLGGNYKALCVKLLPLPQPPVRARTDALTNPSAQRATQLRSVLARVYAVSIHNQITNTVP